MACCYRLFICMKNSWIGSAFVGVHTGHLGFYTDYRDFELDKLVENLKLDTGAQVSYPILNVKITFENGDTRTIRALNEATIKRSDRTMVADVIINRVISSASEVMGFPFLLRQAVQPITNL